MPHICKEPNCKNNVFASGWCKYHQYRRSMQGGDKYTPRRTQKRSKAQLDLFGSKIPRQSKTRKKAHIYYSKGCKELEAEIKAMNNGKIYCFFSGLEIKEFVTWHHLLGRTGDYYIDKEFLVPAINGYHLDYHRMTVEQLDRTDWYPDFLERLKSKCPQGYAKELRKLDKKANISGINLDDNDF